MGVGIISSGDVLVRALGLGNKFGGVAAGAHFLDHPKNWGAGQPHAMDWLRAALRSRRADEYFANFVSSWLGPVGLASVLFIATVSPWLVRNYEIFGKCIFIRSNFGAELRLGNGPGADGTWMSYLHPTQNELALKQYQQMGEIAYVSERKRDALGFIRADYGRFAWLSLKRFVYYWAGRPRSSGSALLDNSVFLASSVLALWGLGRAMRKHRPGAWLFFWLIVCYPAIYYFVYTIPRYRHPIEPEMTILCVFLITEAERKSALPRPKSVMR